MIVHSCFVDDSFDERVELVGPSGCAIDRNLLNNPDYSVGSLMVGVEAHVFKYADRADLYFQCQITILVKVRSITYRIALTSFRCHGYVHLAQGFGYIKN